MNSFRKIALAIILCQFAISSSAPAEVEMIKTEFLTLSFNGSPPTYYYRNGKKVEELHASRQGISAPVFYTGNRILSLYEKATDLTPPKEGEVAPKPLIQVKLPSRSDRVLLVFAYTGKKGELPALKAYGISDKSLGEGDYRVLNFSKQDIYVVLDKKRAAVAAGQQANISGGSWRGEVQDLDVNFGMKANGKIESVYSSVWGHRPERRCFIFVFDRGEKFRPLDIRTFFDVPAVSAARKGNRSGDGGSVENSPG